MSTALNGTDAALPTGLLIDGTWSPGGNGGFFEHHNAATGAVQCAVPLASAGDVDKAVLSARAASAGWRRMPLNQRRDILLKLAALISTDTELARLATLENGTPASFAPAVANLLPADWFTYYAGWCEKIEGETIPVYGDVGLDYTIAEPYGVLGAIIPWNAPVLSLAMKLAPALAAGNCVVLKPPELAPFTSLRFGQLCLDAGVPAGVVNVHVGGREAGDALVKHPDVDKVSFTGGEATARQVLASAAASLKPVMLELGGKSANLVFADSDFELAVTDAVFSSIVGMAGQGCAFPTRLLIDSAIYDKCVDLAVTIAESVAVGDPADPATVMGPVVSEQHCARIQAVIERAVQDRSGQLRTGGERVGGELSEGYFLQPTIFADVDAGSALAQEEIFGPVLSILRFDSEQEAIDIANGTRHGLAGYVWTNDLRRAHRVAGELRAGSVAVNKGLPPVAGPTVPFGGTRASGFGREGGKAGLLECLQTKNIFINLG